MTVTPRMDLSFLLESRVTAPTPITTSCEAPTRSILPNVSPSLSPTPTAITSLPPWSEASESSSIVPSPPPLPPHLRPTPQVEPHGKQQVQEQVAYSPFQSHAPISGIDRLADVAAQVARDMHLQVYDPPSHANEKRSLTPSTHFSHIPNQANLRFYNDSKLQKNDKSKHRSPLSPVSSFHSNYSHDVTGTKSPLTRVLPANTPPTSISPSPDATHLLNGGVVHNNNGVSAPTSRMHICPHCSTPFSLKVRFLHHLLTEHKVTTYDSRTILPCSKCCSAFLRNTDRSKHDLCVHERLRPFRCEANGCNSAFFFEKDLVKHRSTVHLRHKPFRCSICPKAFGKREHMTSHVKRVHHKLRPFRCDVCDIRLASKYNLQGHLKTAAHAAAESLRRRALEARSGAAHMLSEASQPRM